MKILLLVLGAACAVLAVACGGGGSPPERSQADVTATVAAARECGPKKDTVTLTDGRDIELECRDVSFGERVHVAVRNWRDDRSVRFYLVTEEQRNRGLDLFRISEGDLVFLTELTPHDGLGAFDLVVSSYYMTGDGEEIKVASGDSLYVMGRQAGSGHATGPLVVR